MTDPLHRALQPSPSSRLSLKQQHDGYSMWTPVRSPACAVVLGSRGEDQQNINSGVIVMHIFKKILYFQNPCFEEKYSQACCI